MAERKYNEEESEFLQIVSENIPHYRKLKEKTPGQVAKDIGWERRNYKKVENGKRLSTGLTYKKIAESLDVPIDKLFEDRNKK